jgi:predicted nucleic acid-binding protein
MIFVDTSFWAAYENQRDNLHAASVHLMRARRKTTLVTTNHVRGESWTLLRRRAGHRVAVRFLDALERSPRVRLVTVQDDLEAAALLWLRKHDEREYSFVDATSFLVMRMLGISQAFAFDGEFSAAGFHEVRAE